MVSVAIAAQARGPVPMGDEPGGRAGGGLLAQPAMRAPVAAKSAMRRIAAALARACERPVRRVDARVGVFGCMKSPGRCRWREARNDYRSIGAWEPNGLQTPAIRAPGATNLIASWSWVRPPAPVGTASIAGRQLRELSPQYGQRSLYCLSHHIEVDVEVAVRDPVAHAAHVPPRNFAVCFGERRVPLHHFGRRLAQHDQAHDHRLLRSPVLLKPSPVHAIDKRASVCRCLPHVVEVIRKSGIVYT